MLTQLLRNCGIDFARAHEHHHVRDGWIGVRVCPFCGSRNYHLGIQLARRRANCWQCGPHRFWDTLRDLGVPISELSALRDSDASKEDRPKAKAQHKLELPLGLGPLQKAHRDYLRSRGFDPVQIARLWRIKGIGIAPRLRWRIWIPVYHHGDVVSWTTRAIGDQQPRYINASPEQEAMPIKSVLLGADLARHAVIVTEGPLDAWSIGPGGVAVCGLAVTWQQLLAIAAFPVRVLLFDSEPAAQKRARSLADRLEPFPGRTIVAVLETGKDAASADKREIASLKKRFLSSG